MNDREIRCYSGEVRAERHDDNRTLYATADDRPADDPDGLVISDDVKLALLLLVSHFYENRSTVTDVEKMELPMSFNWLVAPYRLIPL
ncbi:TPA: head-tail connector protein [Escherichia coli]